MKYEVIEFGPRFSGWETSNSFVLWDGESLRFPRFRKDKKADITCREAKRVEETKKDECRVVIDFVITSAKGPKAFFLKFPDFQNCPHRYLEGNKVEIISEFGDKANLWFNEKSMLVEIRGFTPLVILTEESIL